MHCVDLGETFPTSIYLQHLASIQPMTSLVKFARSSCTDPPGAPLEERRDGRDGNGDPEHEGPALGGSVCVNGLSDGQICMVKFCETWSSERCKRAQIL